MIKNPRPERSEDIFLLPMLLLRAIFVLRNKYVNSLTYLEQTFHINSCHGLMRQGQKTHAVKPGLRTGKVALYPELGQLASCQPHKQARAKGKQVLINTTRQVIPSFRRGLLLDFKT